MPGISTTDTRVADSARTAQPTVLEVPVTIQGSKPVEGQEKRELFTETTKTTLVFGNGAVVNLKSKLLAGQCVFVRNDQSGREILCRVLESRQAGQTNYTDLEFTAHDPNFWDVRAVQPREPEQSAIPEQKSETQKKIDAAVESLSPTMMMESSPPVREDFPAAVPEEADTESAPSMPTTALVAPEHASEQEPNDAEDAEHLVALMAMDEKVQTDRESAKEGTKEARLNTASVGVPQHEASNSGAPAKAAVISAMELRLRTLPYIAALKNPIAIGIAASVLIASAVGIVWHVKRGSSMRGSNRTSAASAPMKQRTQPVSPQSPQLTGPVVPTLAAPPAQAAQTDNQPMAAPPVRAGVAQDSAARLADAEAAGEIKAAENSHVPSVISVAATIPGSDQAVVAKRKHRKGNDTGTEEIVPPKIVSQSQPGIPQWAKGLDTDGVVQLDALIDEKGNVKETKVLSGPRALQREAERVVALWMFEPAMAGGKPTATHMVLTVQFQM